MTKDYLGYLSIMIAVVSYIPYARMTMTQKIRPHMFSWIVWGTVNAITFFAQASRGAGAGAWATGFSAVGCLFIALLAGLYGEKKITKSDWAAFLSSLAAIPLWYVTKDPLWSVILLTGISTMAFYPTARKSWSKPHEEMTTQFLLSDIKHVASIFAIAKYSLVTVLYPAAGIILNTSLAGAVLFRRIQGKRA